MVINLLLLFSLIVTSGGNLQSPKSKPDFTGTWNARIVADPQAPLQLLKISYSDPRLEIERILIDPTRPVITGLKTTGSRSLVYYTDGRGEVQKSPVPDLAGDSDKSKTQRVGDKFVTTASWTSKQSGRKVTADQTVTLEVSPDGKTLTDTMTFVSEGSTYRVVHLYDRVSGSNTNDINGEWKQRNSDRLITLVVEHHDPEIKVTRRVVTDAQDETQIWVYYTDGRGEINVKNGRQRKSVTTWKGQDLSFSFPRISTGSRMKVNVEESIKWGISNNSQYLIEVTETKMSLDQGYMSPPKAVKLIYARSRT